MNKLPKEKRDRLILAGVVTAVVSGLIWFFLIRAQNASLARHRESILDIENKIYQAETRIRRAASLETELTELRAAVASIEAQMVPREQLTGNLWINNKMYHFLQGKYDLKAKSLSNDPVQGKQFILLPKFPYSAASWDVVFEGHFHELGRFLADFENSFPYLSIQKVRLFPLATPRAAVGATADLPEGFGATERLEHLQIELTVVALFKPIGST